MILVGDIGGTKTRLALFRREGEHWIRGETESFPSQEAADFSEILRSFMNQHPTRLESACFGAPGPVFAGEVDPPNLDWDVSEDDIKKALGIKVVKVVNDLVATAAAVPLLPSDQILTLYEGRPSRVLEERYVVLAPGTGLGQAFLVVHEGNSFIFPSEGGHVDFAPTSDLQIKLLSYLLGRFPRVSYERVLSGPGLENIYDFLRDTVFHGEPEELKERFQSEDRAKVISEAGLEGTHAIAVDALNVFTNILGAYAGNLALTFRANRGVFLGGGIAPKMIDKLRQGEAVKAFLKKERMADLVAAIPLRVIMDDHAALLGAASIAARELQAPHGGT
jgi:glucokinase